MIWCCERCFEGEEIKAIIRGQKQYGICDFCGCSNVAVCDIEDDNDATLALREGFERITEAYTPIDFLDKSFPRENADLLKNILAKEKNLFALEPAAIYRFLIKLLPEKYDKKPELFERQVGIAESVDPDYLTQYSILGTFQWKDFVEEIKEKNRFHTKILNEDILGNFLNSIRKTIPPDTVLYRARIWSEEKGYEPEKMFAPPKGKASAGRANPEGISMLYLSSSDQTALHEVRAGIHDRVTVGKFVLKNQENKVEVIDLSAIDRGNPFSADDYLQFAVNLPHLEKIEEEISKPMRRTDSVLNYLPTQYICDYIKSMGVAGIEFRSTMHESGVNYAFFDESHFECKEVKHYSVKIKGYDSVEIQPSSVQ